MTAGLHEKRVEHNPSNRHPLRRAWISIALIPVALFLGSILSEQVYRLMGYEPMATVPLWLDLVGWIPTLVVFSIPCAAAVIYGREASRTGDHRGRVPLLIGWLASAGFLIMAIQAVVSSSHL
ncbi:MAG TPA: hypothetical protein VIC07_08740 [Acidimicrobiia bacterium]